MLRRLSVRGKILAALAVPILALFVAAAILGDQAISEAGDPDGSQIRAIVTIGVAALVIVVSIVMGVLVARSIATPLRRLTRAAQTVRDQLPLVVEQVAVPGRGPTLAIPPLPVESSDELGELAAAFNDVNSTTLGVAREQAALRASIAEMFVNVARRDQVLLNRQLTFLDELERSEDDPTTMSNLFRLDHLATRMRRNAESLLVLAGIDSGRRVRRPMPMSDIARTAASEIELFDRVRLDVPVDPLMLGHNALTTAHLIAELLENATKFSEPHTPVEVSTEHDGQYVRVVIRDHGPGMSPAELTDAMRRVSSRAAADIIGSARLGLYVVGRLAEGLEATVRFGVGQDGTGTEAVVELPLMLFVPDSNIPLPERSAVGDAAFAAPDLGSATPDSAGAYLPEEDTVRLRGGQIPTEIQPSVAIPVDIEALTDGTTEVGMPRRRPRGVTPSTAAPSASLGTNPTGAIVLPPLATPSLPIDLAATEDTWSPPSAIEPGGALPSRHRAASADAPGVQAPTEAPILDVGSRTALFSNFRSRHELDTAAHIPVDSAATPVAERGDAARPAPAADDTRTGRGPGVPAAVDRSPVDHVPMDQDADQGTWSPQFDLEDAPALTDRPIKLPGLPDLGGGRGPVLFDADRTAQIEQVPADRIPASFPDDHTQRSASSSTAEEAPSFDDIMPTRRSMRETPSRRRGRFGRRTRPGESDAGEDFIENETAAEPGRADLSAAASAPPAAPAADAYAPPADAAYGSPTPTDAAYGSPTPTDAAYGSPAVPDAGFVVDFADLPDDHTVRLRAPRPVTNQDVTATQFLPPTDPMIGLHTGDTTVMPAVPAPAPPQPGWSGLGPGTDAGSYGPPSPLRRRPLPEPLEPLDPGYISDSVEAHSEWVASAVLRDEVSQLLRNGPDFGRSPGAEGIGSYEPVRMETGAGLTRRARGDRADFAEHFTARIERDPDQLRARLAAFQNATARGRAEAHRGYEGHGPNLDPVHDSAPQAR